MALWLIVGALLVVALFTFINGNKKEKDVKGKVVLVTGGASGIGLGMARKFAELGAKVVAWDINAKGLADVEAEFKAKNYVIHTYVCDVSDRENIYKVADQVKQDVGKVDILINNAGIVIGKSFMDTTDAQTEKVMRVNAMAILWSVKAFLPDMIKSSGHLVTIASAAGTTGCPLLVDYCASKYAACGFMDALRAEFIHNKINNVKFSTVMPFYINTGMFDGAKSALMFPILDPDFVVNTIVHGVRTEEVEIFIPGALKLRFFIRLFPTAVGDVLANITGINRTMDEFKGRAAK